MVDQIAELAAEIAQALRAHRDGEIFQSFFRSPDAVICAATLLGEIGDTRHRHRDAIAADARQAPSPARHPRHPTNRRQRRHHTAHDAPRPRRVSKRHKSHNSFLQWSNVRPVVSKDARLGQFLLTCMSPASSA
jgi:hypothetical protein